MAVTGKIDRKYMAHYIDAGSLCGGLTPKYERLGKDLEEYNVELNPDTETSKNILGESTFKHKPRLMDWEQDGDMIVPAVNKVAGKEIRAVPYMHWWTFFGYFMESGECLFNTVVGIRSKKAKGEKLDKWEKKFYQENKNIIDIKTRLSDEEQAYKDALNEMLNLK